MFPTKMKRFFNRHEVPSSKVSKIIEKSLNTEEQSKYPPCWYQLIGLTGIKSAVCIIIPYKKKYENE